MIHIDSRIGPKARMLHRPIGAGPLAGGGFTPLEFSYSELTLSTCFWKLTRHYPFLQEDILNGT